MSTKKKLIISLSVLSVTIIVAIASVVGVLALINTDFNFGGSISFTATNIHATVSKASVTGGTLTDETKMQEIFMDAENSGSDDVATWSGVNLNFPENGADVVIKFTITNHSENEKLRLTIGELTGTYNNATMSVAITGEAEGVKTAVIDPAVPADADAGTDRIEYSKEVVITFQITDKNKDASITNFNIPISLTKFDGWNVTVAIAEDLIYISNSSQETWTNYLSVKTNAESEYTRIGTGYSNTYSGKGEMLSIDYSNGGGNICSITIIDNYGNTETYFDYYAEMELTKDIQLTITNIDENFQSHSGGTN